MNESVAHKRLQELADTLKERIDALHQGELSRADLEMLTDHSRELFERLVVLRYKAYDQEVNPGKEQAAPAASEPVSAPVETAAEPEASPAPILFRIDDARPEPALPNQVSLIDAIEEVTRQETPEPVPAIARPSVVAEQFHAPESINDRLSKSVGAQETLAKKLEQTPITDLKKAITLNQRFQFSKELFKGNNQDYEVAIDRLNSTSRDEAMRTIEGLRSKYAWNNESPVTQDFVELVERRFMA